jgi:uncharacterized membrane protein
MKTTFRGELPHLLLIAAMFLGGALSWAVAPDRIPVHWNVRGEVNGYGGKVEGLVLLPLIALGVYLALRFLPRLDPGRANYPGFARPYGIIRFTTLLAVAVVHFSILLQVHGRPVPMERISPLLVGGLFLVLGGVLGKIRPNWFVGVRTPWTLSSKASWVKTHRVAGWLMLGCGSATIASALLLPPPVTLGVVVTSAVGAAVVSTVYSYQVWRRDPDKLPPAGTLPADES